MDYEDVGLFFEGLNLELDVFNFDFLAPIPMPFEALGIANRVSDRGIRSLKLADDFRGKPLKKMLKPLSRHEAVAAKRKKRSSSPIASAAKHTRLGSCDSNMGGCQSVMTDSQVLQAREAVEEEIPVNKTDDKVDLGDEKVKEAIQLLNDFLEKENLTKLREIMTKSRDNEELKTGLGVHLISKLAGTAFTNTKQRNRPCPCGCLKQLPINEKMFIGSEKTWYGELDVLAGNPATGSSVMVMFDENYGCVDTGVRGENEDVTEKSESDSDEAQEDEYQGGRLRDRTDVEIQYRGLNQLISQAVVFAFTEYNRHKPLGKWIPSILISRSGYQYVIYNPVDDILLVSHCMMYNKEDNFDPSTFFRPFIVLWIILNYRIFFANNPDFNRLLVKSGFHEKMMDLQEYQNLAEYSENITEKHSLLFRNDTPNTLSADVKDLLLEKNQTSVSLLGTKLL